MLFYAIKRNKYNTVENKVCFYCTNVICFFRTFKNDTLETEIRVALHYYLFRKSNNVMLLVRLRNAINTVFRVFINRLLLNQSQKVRKSCQNLAWLAAQIRGASKKITLHFLSLFSSFLSRVFCPSPSIFFSVEKNALLSFLEWWRVNSKLPFHSFYVMFMIRQFKQKKKRYFCRKVPSGHQHANSQCNL